MLLDIEGTTTALSFFEDVLLPYVRTHIERVLSNTEQGSRLATAIQSLRSEWEHEAERLDEGDGFGTGAKYALRLMKRSSESTALKEIQALIWEQGYSDGSLRGHVFDDVPGAIATWSSLGLRIYTFSASSVLAQRLLLSHSIFGDLSKTIDGYFDTTFGTKTHSVTYDGIARTIGIAPASVFFLSDEPQELSAARGAGMQVGWIHRPGSSLVHDTDLPLYATFAMVPRPSA